MTMNFLSGIFGSSLVALLVKWAITRALQDLDSLHEKGQRIAETLAGIAVRLEKLTEHETTLVEHTKQLAYLEGSSLKKKH